MPIKKKPAKKKPKAKSELPALYKKLRGAWAERQEFKDARRKIFTQLADLEEEVDVIQTKIKKALQAEFKGRESGEYDVFSCDTFDLVVQAKNGLNEKELLRVHEKMLREIPGLVVDKTVVDKKVLANAVKEGLFGDIDIRAFRDEPMTPSVFFKPPTTEEE